MHTRLLYENTSRTGQVYRPIDICGLRQSQISSIVLYTVVRAISQSYGDTQIFFRGRGTYWIDLSKLLHDVEVSVPSRAYIYTAMLHTVSEGQTKE